MRQSSEEYEIIKNYFDLQTYLEFDPDIKLAKPKYRNDFAIKLIDQKDEIIIQKVMELQQKQQCNQIIKIYDVIEQNTNKYILMELGTISLKTFLNQKLNISQKLQICSETSEIIEILNRIDYPLQHLNSQSFIKVGENFKFIPFQSKKNLIQEELFNLQVGSQEAQQQKDSQEDLKFLSDFFYEVFNQELQDQRTDQIQENEQSENAEKINISEIKELIKRMKDQNIQNRLSIKQVIDQINQLKQQLTAKTQVQQIIPAPMVQYKNLTNLLIDAPTKQFPNRKFHLTELLGDGGEGGVFQADPKNETYYKANQISIAIKVQSTISDAELNFIDFLIDYQGKAFQISNLIRVYERFKFQNQHFIIMELGGKDLLSCLQEKNKLTISQKEQIIYQLTLSISFLHSNALIHRDIKPENFIQIGTNFKLIDFGLIKKGKENLRLTKKVGTPLYQAPEIINGSEVYSSSIDIWSLGCLFYEIFQESSLFNGDDLSQVQQQILNYCQDQQIIHNSINQLPIKQELKDLIKKMIDPNPFNRPTIENVKNLLLPKFQLQNPSPFQKFTKIEIPSEQQIFQTQNIIFSNQQKKNPEPEIISQDYKKQLQNQINNFILNDDNFDPKTFQENLIKQIQSYQYTKTNPQQQSFQKPSTQFQANQHFGQQQKIQIPVNKPFTQIPNH